MRKFLYTITQKMRVYKLKLAKMTKKTAKIRPGATERPNGLRPKKRPKSMIFAVVNVKKLIFDKNLTNWYFSDGF